MSSVSQSAPRGGAAGTLAWVSLAIVWFVWGSTFLGIRVAVQSVPPLLMSGTRYVVAGVLLSAIVWILQRGRRIVITWPELRTVLITAVLLLVIGNGFLSVAEVRLESGTAALLVATVPLWMIALDALLERKMRPLSLAGIAFGSLGVAALFGAPSAHSSPLSVFLVLAGSLSWAIGSVYARRQSEHKTNPMLVGFEMTIAGLIMCLAGISTGELTQLRPIPPAAIAGWAWLVFAGAMIAYSAYSYAVRTLPTNIVATYAYVNPVVAVVLGALLLKEPITLNVVIGGAAIVLSVIAIVIGNRADAREVEEVREAA